LQPWLADRAKLPVGPLFCVIVGPTRGHAWSASAARLELHRVAIDPGVRRRLAPHQLRHAHAVELLHEGIPLPLHVPAQLSSPPASSSPTWVQRTRTVFVVLARKRPPRQLTGFFPSCFALASGPRGYSADPTPGYGRWCSQAC
jgi:hypothetical protein